MNLRNNVRNQNFTQRDRLVNQYRTARTTLLIVLILSVVSVFTTAFTENATYFFFAAAIPRFIVMIGGILCGKYPEIDYKQFIDKPLPSSVLIVFIIIGLLISLLYLVCWLLSAKGRSLGLILGVVFFGIDTLSMFLLFNVSAIIIDLVLHGVVLAYLIIGIVSLNKLKSLPPEEPENVETTNQTVEVVSEDKGSDNN